MDPIVVFNQWSILSNTLEGVKLTLPSALSSRTDNMDKGLRRQCQMSRPFQRPSLSIKTVTMVRRKRMWVWRFQCLVPNAFSAKKYARYRPCKNQSQNKPLWTVFQRTGAMTLYKIQSQVEKVNCILYSLVNNPLADMGGATITSKEMIWNT